MGKLSHKLKTRIRVGIGSTKSDNENLLISFSESLRALKYANDREIIHIDDIPEEQIPDTDFVEKRIKCCWRVLHLVYQRIYCNIYSNLR